MSLLNLPTFIIVSLATAAIFGLWAWRSIDAIQKNGPGIYKLIGYIPLTFLSGIIGLWIVDKEELLRLSFDSSFAWLFFGIAPLITSTAVGLFHLHQRKQSRLASSEA